MNINDLRANLRAGTLQVGVNETSVQEAVPAVAAAMAEDTRQALIARIREGEVITPEEMRDIVRHQRYLRQQVLDQVAPMKKPKEPKPPKPPKPPKEPKPKKPTKAELKAAAEAAAEAALQQISIF